MIKKIVLLLFFLLISNNFVFAKEYAVMIKPANKISTSDETLKEGDFVDFVTVESVSAPNFKLAKGQKVTGLITSLEPNGFWVKPASVYIENFKTKDSNNNLVKLNGIVYKQGSDYHNVMDFILIETIRGGEVNILPEKDTFTLYVEDNL